MTSSLQLRLFSLSRFSLHQPRYIVSLFLKPVFLFFLFVLKSFFLISHVHPSLFLDNLAIATKDTDIITNAVILLFVNEIDERLYQLASACNIHFISEVDESFSRNSYHAKKELIIHRALHKLRKKLRNILFIKKYNKAPHNDEEENSSNENNVVESHNQQLL